MASPLTPVRERATDLRRLAEAGRRRGALVTSPRRYFFNELFLRPGVHRYRLASNGDVVRIRHQVRDDSFILEEIFGQMDAYAIPPRIAARLAAVGVTKIVDLGGNVGMATLKFAREFPQATLTSVEPEPENGRLLDATVRDNGLADRVTVLHVAASNAPGTARFVGGHAGRSHLAQKQEDGFEVELVDIFPTLEGAQLLKMDIESGEWPILRDERLAKTSLAAICLEYHEADDHAGGSAQELLEAAGFEIVSHEEDPQPGWAKEGVIWCVRG